MFIADAVKISWMCFMETLRFPENKVAKEDPEILYTPREDVGVFFCDLLYIPITD
jgi:hypothetical protein